MPATIEALQNHIFNWTIWPDFAKLPTEDKPVMGYQTLNPGETFVDKGRTLEMIEVKHIIPGVGYRVSCDTGSFAFSGDTTNNDNFWNVLNERDGLDLLLVEAAFANADEALSKRAGHYTPRLLAEDLKKLKHQPDICLTHAKPGMEDVIFNECQEAITDRNLIAGYSGQVFTL